MIQMNKRFYFNVFGPLNAYIYAKNVTKLDSNISKQHLLGSFIFWGPWGAPPKINCTPKVASEASK